MQTRPLWSLTKAMEERGYPSAFIQAHRSDASPVACGDVSTYGESGEGR